ncbi:MAG: hypothetical protein IPM37_22935 [Hahellaceae bacterium]|nr:hypothetical protein [Hahellaceae bacterium]
MQTRFSMPAPAMPGQRSALEALQQLAPTSLRVLQLQGMENSAPAKLLRVANRSA